MKQKQLWLGIFAVVTCFYVYAEDVGDKVEMYDPLDQLRAIFSQPYQPARSDFTPGNPGSYRIYKSFLLLKDESEKQPQYEYVHIEGRVYCNQGNVCQPVPVKDGWVIPKIKLNILPSSNYHQAEFSIVNVNIFRGDGGSTQVSFPILDGR